MARVGTRFHIESYRANRDACRGLPTPITASRYDELDGPNERGSDDPPEIAHQSFAMYQGKLSSLLSFVPIARRRVNSLTGENINERANIIFNRHDRLRCVRTHDDGRNGAR